MSAAIQFSGGKDSLAVLYLLRGQLRDITVYFGDTGIVYPHMREFVFRTCERLGARLKVVSPPIPITEFHKARGLPSDIVPIEATSEMLVYSKESRPVKIQSVLSCCGAMLWQPLQRAMVDDGIKTIFRGSKASDSHVGVPDGYIDEGGVIYRSPIWSWSDADVFAYLKSVDAEMPDHYGDVNNSFDCIFCTAFLTHAGAAERLRYTKSRYPSFWPEVKRRLTDVQSAIDSERERLSEAFAV